MYLILDIARGLAALSVFLFHMGGTFEVSIPFMAQLAKYGSLGVPLFFVLSGYVITASAVSVIRNSRSASTFLKRRFLRIFPPFWASILVVIAIPYVMESFSYLKTGHYAWPILRFQQLTSSEWVQIVTLTKIFMSTDGDLQGEFSPVNSVYWTLAIEFQFYLCVYIALIFRKYFYIILLLITMASILTTVFSFHLNAGLFIHFWPMFAVGILLYLIAQKEMTLEKLRFKYKKILSVFLVVLSLVVLLISAYLNRLEEILLYLFPSTSLSFAVVSAFILWCSIPLEPILVSLKNEGNIVLRNVVKASAFLGVISYSLYLLHGKILGFPAMFARQVTPVNSALYPVLILGGTILLCAVFYHYVEKPFMSSRQQKIYEDALTTASGGRA